MLLFVNMQLINIVIRQGVRIGRIVKEGHKARTVEALQSINGCYPHVALVVLHNTLGVITGKTVFYRVMCKSI